RQDAWEAHLLLSGRAAGPLVPRDRGATGRRSQDLLLRPHRRLLGQGRAQSSGARHDGPAPRDPTRLPELGVLASRGRDLRVAEGRRLHRGARLRLPAQGAESAGRSARLRRRAGSPAQGLRRSLSRLLRDVPAGARSARPLHRPPGGRAGQGGVLRVLLDCAAAEEARMRRNLLKKRLKSGETVYGTMVQEVRTPAIAQILSRVGFDFFMIDMEHGAYSLETAADIIRVARLCDLCPLVRVRSLEYHLIAGALDQGAMGIMLPRVERREQ